MSAKNVVVSDSNGVVEGRSVEVVHEEDVLLSIVTDDAGEVVEEGAGVALFCDLRMQTRSDVDVGGTDSTSFSAQTLCFLHLLELDSLENESALQGAQTREAIRGRERISVPAGQARSVTHVRDGRLKYWVFQSQRCAETTAA